MNRYLAFYRQHLLFYSILHWGRCWSFCLMWKTWGVNGVTLLFKNINGARWGCLLWNYNYRSPLFTVLFLNSGSKLMHMRNKNVCIWILKFDLFLCLLTVSEWLREKPKQVQLRHLTSDLTITILSLLLMFLFYTYIYLQLDWSDVTLKRFSDCTIF